MSYDRANTVFVLVEVAPSGAQRIKEVFEADSLEAAQGYAAQHNKTDLDRHVQRFRIAGEYGVRTLFKSDSVEYEDESYYTAF